MSTTTLIITIIIAILITGLIYFLIRGVREERSKRIDAQLEHVPTLVKKFSEWPISSPKDLTYCIDLPNGRLKITYAPKLILVSIKGKCVNNGKSVNFNENFDKSTSDQQLYDAIQEIITPMIKL